MLVSRNIITCLIIIHPSWRWSGGAMVLGKLPVPGRPTFWIVVGQGPIALAAGAGGCCLGIFTLLYPFSPLSPSLWETARYRLKYCLIGPLNQNNQSINTPAVSISMEQVSKNESPVLENLTMLRLKPSNRN